MATISDRKYYLRLCEEMLADAAEKAAMTLDTASGFLRNDFSNTATAATDAAGALLLAVARVKSARADLQNSLDNGEPD